MDKTVLQIPMKVSLRKSAEKAAVSAGFSSVQEVVRVFLNSFASDSIGVGFYDRSVPLSERAERRYLNMIQDIKDNHNIAKTTSAEDLISILG